MHPAPSVIVFTVASGAGYGLLAWLGVLAGLGLLPADRWLGVAGLGAAAALITGGLVASTWHLGRPERAWRAVSQWRSSWLSREAVAALATYVPLAMFAYGWVVVERIDGPWAIAAWAAPPMAAATVACTGMIYASLKPIPQWHDPWVVPGYLACAAASGAVLLDIAGSPGTWVVATALAVAWSIKLAYWRSIGRAGAATTRETATGLGVFGAVRPLDPPHTGENYLLKEMGFAIARKHAARLRRLAQGLGFALPITLSLAAGALPTGLATAASVLAALSCGVGLVIERWLFFAEAVHTVTLYYRPPAP